MLLIQDVHIVIGREEVPFEDHYRSYAGLVSSGEGVRFAGCFWAPHGGGQGYEAVTLTLVDDVAALVVHQDRVADGDLAAEWRALEARQRHIESSAHELAPWSRVADRPDGDGPTALFVLDRVDVGGSLDGALAEIGQRSSASSDTTVEPIAAWAPLLGGLDQPVLHVLSRVRSDVHLRAALADVERYEPWTGSPVSTAARRQTRLLRSTTWSPTR